MIQICYISSKLQLLIWNTCPAEATTEAEAEEAAEEPTEEEKKPEAETPSKKKGLMSKLALYSSIFSCI